MAAPYSPNGRDPMEIEAIAHSRSHSALSSSPLLTNRALDSHLIESPLRSPLASTSAGFSFSKPANEDIVLSQNPLPRTATPIAQKSLFRNVLHAFKRRTRLVTLSLEFIMGIWATYNTVRYFLALLHYRNTLGQEFSLSLAITTGISAVLTLWAIVLSTYIVRCLPGQDGRIWHLVLLSLRFLSTFFLLVPAVVNIAVVFVWKSSPNSDLDLHRRCHLDIDAVWSIVPQNDCPVDAPSWSLWVALSFIRFLLTASLIAIYLTASFFVFISPAKSSHRHSRSDAGSMRPSLARITALTDHHQASDLTLVTLNSETSLQRGLPRLMRSRSFDAPPDYDHYHKTTTHGESDREMSGFGFVDRFRSLITQITREMEESLEATRSNSPTFTETDRNYATIPKSTNNVFNLPPLPAALGYNEFGIPYPPEERVRVLGGFVRRMPTIESMGSGEMGSRTSDTSHRHGTSAGNRTTSRPSTGNTLLTVNTAGHDSAGSASDHPSRANSPSSRAERLLRPVNPSSEHGELLSRTDRRLSTPSSGDPTFRSMSSPIDDAMSSGTVATYNTAAMDSYSPTSVYHDGIPVETAI